MHSKHSVAITQKFEMKLCDNFEVNLFVGAVVIEIYTIEEERIVLLRNI